MNPAVALTLILLSLMIGAGVISASWGYTLGREALTGIRQPDARPTSGTPVNQQPILGHHGGVVLAKETEILEKVKARMSSGGQ